LVVSSIRRPTPSDHPSPNVSIVTALTPLPRHTDRIAVEVDGAEVAVVPLEVAGRLGLVVRAEASVDVMTALTDAAAGLKTYDRALRLLAARGRSVRELRRRLLVAKEPEVHVDAALERLVSAGLLDDEEYARQVARSQMIGRGYAPRRLKQELARRGVARDVADRAIELVLAEDAAPGSFGVEAGVDPGETIERLARRKLRGLASLDADTRARRLYAFLARRGYDSDDIRMVTARLLAEENIPDLA
jgi:regulatory protein